MGKTRTWKIKINDSTPPLPVTGPPFQSGPKQLRRIADSPPLPSPLFDNYFARYSRRAAKYRSQMNCPLRSR